MIKYIFKGIKAYTGTFQLISKLKLWKYFAVPIVISLICFVAILISAYGLSDKIGLLLTKLWKWELWKETVAAISNFIGGTIIVVFGFILYKHMVMALSAPFMSPVSEKIEAYLIDYNTHEHRITSFYQQLWRGIRINIRNLIKEILFTIPILLFGLIPVIGILSTIFLFLVQAYYTGFGNMDYTLERHLNYKESIKFVNKHSGYAMGNGIVFMLILLIPILGVLLVLPLSVTAASINTVKLLDSEN